MASGLSSFPALINGNFTTSVEIFDRGLMYGDGLFETVRVVKGVAPLWPYHCQRLALGCSRLGIDIDQALFGRLWEYLQRVIAKAGRETETCVVKIMITRGSGGRGYKPPSHVNPTEIVICYPPVVNPEVNLSKGISVSVCNHRLSENPALAGLKHLNRLDQVIASGELDESVAEGIMLDQKGNVIEGTKTNILFFDKKRVITPKTTVCGVEGVVRRFLFDNLAKVGLEGRVEEVALSDVDKFDGMAVTNSVIGLWPVQNFNGLDLRISPVIEIIKRLFKEELMFEYVV